MTQNTITEAAKLVGKSSKTLYRLISQGTLSATIDENGKKQLDSSELLRVFGALRQVRENQESLETVPMSQRETPDATARMALLEAELRHAKEMLAEKDARIAALDRALLLLEDRSREKKRKFWPW